MEAFRSIAGSAASVDGTYVVVGSLVAAAAIVATAQIAPCQRKKGSDDVSAHAVDSRTRAI